MFIALILSLNLTAARADYRNEGMYDIQISCASVQADCNSGLIEQVNRLSIVQSHSRTGLWVTLAATNPTSVIDSFYDVQTNAETGDFIAEAQGDSRSGAFSYLQFHLDPVTGELTGSIIDYRSQNTMSLRGRPLARVSDILFPRSGSQFTDLIGRYKGTIHGIAGTLRISRTPTQKIVGSFASDRAEFGQPAFSLSFDAGKWTEDGEVLQLSFHNPRFSSRGALHLTVVPGKSAAKLRGLFVNGFVHSFEDFVRLP